MGSDSAARMASPASQPLPHTLRILPGRKVKVVLSRCCGSAWKKRPTGPSAGVKGSLSPHSTSRGRSPGITSRSSTSGRGPGGPVGTVWGTGATE